MDLLSRYSTLSSGAPEKTVEGTLDIAIGEGMVETHNHGNPSEQLKQQ